MTSKTQESRPAPQPVPEMVPLGACVLSPLNPRQEACEAEIASLAASIRAVGLLQNLAGWRTAETQVEIVAGGRRLRALGLIAEEDGTDPAEVVVPVLMAATGVVGGRGQEGGKGQEQGLGEEGGPLR